MKLIPFFLVILPSLAFGFNYEAYVQESMTNLLERAQQAVETHDHTGGVEIILPVTKLHLYEELAKQPFECNTDSLFKFLQIMGLGKKDRLPPINTCIAVKASSGENVIFFVQDQVADFIPKKVKVGQKLHLYAIWVYVSDNDKLPYLLLNGFKSE